MMRAAVRRPAAHSARAMPQSRRRRAQRPLQRPPRSLYGRAQGRLAGSR